MLPELVKNKLVYTDIDLLYLGPRCDYHPEKSMSPTGFTWAELEAYRMQSPRYTHSVLEGNNLIRALKALKKQSNRRFTDTQYAANFLKLIQCTLPIKDPGIKTTYTFSIPVDPFQTDLNL